MHSRLSSFILILAVVALSLFNTTSAHAAPGGCTVIAYLPYSITSPGCYCLADNLTVVLSTGAAISIYADNVNLDLDGYTIKNDASGNSATGITSNNKINVRVHGGSVRGFNRAVHLTGSSPQYSYLGGLVVEDMTCLENGVNGILISGAIGAVVRRNSIVGTNNTVSSTAYTYGILVQGPGATICDNSVFYTLNKPGLDSVGIAVTYSPGSVIERNAIGNVALPTNNASYGVALSFSSTNCVVADNRVSLMTKGIYFATGITGTYHDNVASGCTTPYTGGTGSGHNF